MQIRLKFCLQFLRKSLFLFFLKANKEFLYCVDKACSLVINRTILLRNIYFFDRVSFCFL